MCISYAKWKISKSCCEKLGFSSAQLAPSLIVDKIGNPYSASSLTGLAAVLDIAKPKQKILLSRTGQEQDPTDLFLKLLQIYFKREKGFSVSSQIEKKKYISYATYLKQTHTI